MLRRLLLPTALILVAAGLSGCAVGPAVKEMMGPPMSCSEAQEFVQEGQASWYGSFHQGRPTASGERFDLRKMTAAHRRLPLGSQVKVINEQNGREAYFKINDRGPYVADRIIDISQSGAQKLGFERDGVVPVKLEVVACGKWKRTAEAPAAETFDAEQPPRAEGAPEPASPIPWEMLPTPPPPSSPVPTLNPPASNPSPEPEASS